jgi:hypothetical protein
MAQFLYRQCSYAELRNDRLIVCQTQTYGTQYCQRHQWAQAELEWLEKNVAEVEVSIRSEGDDGR